MTHGEDRPAFAGRLDGLFRQSRPHGRRWTNDEVATEIKVRHPDLKVSGAYLSALRTGRRANPSRDLQEALAKFFGVAPAFFSDPEYFDQASRQLALLEELSQADVRSIALRTVGLPGESLGAVTAMLDQIRKLHGLPPVEE